MSSHCIPSKTEVMGWNARTLADYMNGLKLSGCDKVVMKKSIDGAQFLKMTDVDFHKFPKVHVPMVTNIQNQINRRGLNKGFSPRLNASRYPKQDKDIRDADEIDSECDNTYDCPEECMEGEESYICPMSEPSHAGLRESEEGSDDEYEEPPSEHMNVLPRPLGLGKPLGDGEYIGSCSPPPQRRGREASASGSNNDAARHPLPKMDTSGQRSVKTPGPSPPCVDRSRKPGQRGLPKKDLPKSGEGSPFKLLASFEHKIPKTEGSKPSDRSTKFNQPPLLPQLPWPSITGRTQHGQTLESECDDTYDCPEECMEGEESYICPMSEPSQAGLRESEEGSDDEYEEPPSEHMNVLPRPLGLGKPLGDGEYIDSPGRSTNSLLQHPGSEVGASGCINTKLKKTSSFTHVSPQTKDPKPSDRSNRTTKFNTAPPLPQPPRPSIRGHSSNHGQTLESECDDTYDCPEECMEGEESYICPMSEPSQAGLRESEEGSDDEYEEPPSEHMNVLPRPLGLGKRLGDGEYIDSPGRSPHSLLQRPGSEGKLAHHPLPKIDASVNMSNKPNMTELTRLIAKTNLKKTSSFTHMSPQTKDPKPSDRSNRSTKFNTAPPLPQSSGPSIRGHSSKNGQTLESECDDTYDCPEECMEGEESYICPMSEPSHAGLRESEEGSDDEYEEPPSEHMNVLPRPLGLGKPLGDGEYIGMSSHSPQRPGREAAASTSSYNNGKLAHHPLLKIDTSAMSNKPDMTRLIAKTKLKKTRRSSDSSTHMSPQTKHSSPEMDASGQTHTQLKKTSSLPSPDDNSSQTNRSTKFNTAPPLPQSPRPSRGRSSQHGQTPDMDPCWYKGQLTRAQAEAALRKVNKDGAFVVRDSSTGSSEQPYTLMVLYQGKVYNIQIRNCNNVYTLGTGLKNCESFPRVKEVIDYYTHTPLVLLKSLDSSYACQSRLLHPAAL